MRQRGETVEVGYQRDLNHNYMFVENPGISGREYTVRMMEQNQIDGLLPVRVRKMDGKTYLYYEITSRQPLTSIYESRRMGRREIERLLNGVREEMERLGPYLLSGSDLLFGPQYIFLDVDTGQVWLCCLPGAKQLTDESGQDGFHVLAEFLLKHLDHGDRGAVDLGYELFARVSRENFSLAEALKAVTSRKVSFPGDREQELSGEDEAEWRADGEEERKQKKETWSRRRSWAEEQEGSRTAVSEPGGRRPYPEEPGGRRSDGGDRAGKREMTGKKKEEWGETGKQRKREEMDRNRGYGQRRKKEQQMKGKGRKLLLSALAAALFAGAFGCVVYFGNLDLTQTGGLAFACLAAVWGIYTVLTQKKEKKRKIWPEDDEEDEEDAFLEALASEIYQQGESEKEESYGWELPGKDRMAAHQTGRMGGERDPDLYQPGGETRCLAESELRSQFRLVSQEPEKYPDLEINADTAVLGKKRDQVDIWIEREAVSRMHARLERTPDCCFVTDLNSMNGTFVNGERLRPNEKRPLYHGDRVSFANLHYRVKIREF